MMTRNLLVHAILPMLVFVGFIVLTLRVRQGDAPRRSASLRLLLGYVIAVSMFAGLTGRDLWPFAAWHYVSYAVGESGDFVRLVGVDASGREEPLDSRTFEPLEFPQVMGFLENRIESMAPEERTALLDLLLQRAQEGLARARAGLPVGTFARFLGPLTAPVFQAAATPWSDRANLPDELTELRFYRVYWRADGDAIRVENQVLIASTRS
jgi:hypothetical protein